MELHIAILIGLGEAPKALILAESLSAALPQRAAVWFRLACVHAAAGDIPAAKAAVERCIEIDPEWRLWVVDEPGLAGIW